MKGLRTWFLNPGTPMPIIIKDGYTTAIIGQDEREITAVFLVTEGLGGWVKQNQEGTISSGRVYLHQNNANVENGEEFSGTPQFVPLDRKFVEWMLDTLRKLESTRRYKLPAWAKEAMLQAKDLIRQVPLPPMRVGNRQIQKDARISLAIKYTQLGVGAARLIRKMIVSGELETSLSTKNWVEAVSGHGLAIVDAEDIPVLDFDITELFNEAAAELFNRLILPGVQNLMG